MFEFMILGIVIIIIIIIANPKWGTFMIWPILFTYPHGWWFYRGFLPLNIGMDDLFCIVLFLAVLIRRNFLGAVRLRLGYAFWVVTGFTIVAIIANIAGSREAPPFERILYVKDILKLGVYFGLFYAILHCIDNVRDLKIQFTMFSLAAGLGAVIIILQYLFPYQMEIFAAPAVLEERGLQYRGRAFGAFMNANSASCVMICSVAFVLATMRLQKKLISKIIFYSLVFLLLIAGLVTGSRTGLLALIGLVVLIAFVGKSKKIGWLLIIAATVIAISFGGIRERVQERVKIVYDPISKVWGVSAHARFNIWKSYLETTTAKDYVLGQGFRQGANKNGMGTHSLYLALLTVYGFGGMIWAVASLIIFFRKALASKDFGDPLVSAVSAGCAWSIIAWGLYGLNADAVSSQYTRYLLFYLVVLLDRAYCFGREQKALLLYEEEESGANWPMIYPEQAKVY